MIRLTTCNTPAEAELIGSLLAVEGIEYFLPQDSAPAPVLGFPSGYDVFVRTEDHARALQVIAGQRPQNGVPTVDASNSTDLSAKLSGRGKPLLRLFRVAVLLEAAITTGFWIQAHHTQPSEPAHVQEYLESLAAPVWWDLGYWINQGGFCLGLIGSLFLFFRARAGRPIYVVGVALQIGSFWVFPGGIIHGLASLFGGIQGVLTGFILTAAFLLPVLEPPEKRAP